jgi:acylphosphatase
MAMTDRRALRIVVEGRVQGVAFRDWAVRTARGLGVDGWVRNRRDGSVEALLAGSGTAVAAMVEACRHGPPLARVDRLRSAPAVDTQTEGFVRLPDA